MARTLDTNLQQVCIDFFDDDAFNWHHRLLLIQATGARWIVGTPDLDVEILDLASHRVVPLQRNAEFPRRVRDEVYCFDPMTDAERDDLMIRAGQLAKVMGITIAAGTASGERAWRVADTGHDRFDEEIPDSDLVANENFVQRADVGLYMISTDPDDIVWVAIERVRKEDHDEWLENKRSGPGRDLRICPVTRDATGQRVVSLRESLTFTERVKQDDFPFSGPSAAEEVMRAVSSAGLELHLFPARWEAMSGITPTSGIAREHRLAFELLRLFQSYDQLSLLNSAGIEGLCRRIVIIQRAVRRNPKAPDFAGLEQFLQSSFDESGGILTSKFDQYMAETQKNNAMILKQTRLWGEEVDAEKKKQADRAAGGGKGPVKP